MCCIDQKLPKNTHTHLPSIAQSLLVEDVPCGHQQQQHGDRRPDLLLLLLRVRPSATSATAPASLVAVIFLLIARLLSKLLKHRVAIVVGMLLLRLFGHGIVRRRLVVAPLLVVVVGLFRRWHLALGEEILKASRILQVA